jgi:hypothetical protein
VRTDDASRVAARFELVAQCGDMPQIEQPARLLELVASMR